MEELEKNKEIIINLNKDLEKYKNENITSLKEIKNENNAQENNLNRKEEKSIDINEEQINLRNEQMNNLKEINEEYKKEIKEKENLIDQLYEKINFYIKEKEDAEQKIIHINAIHERLQNELGDIKKSIKEKEDYNNNLINYLKEEAIEAKVKFANSNYESDNKYMKLKRRFDKLIAKLNSLGLTVKEIK